MKFNIQNIIILLPVEELQEMLHFIIIHLFNWSGVWIWNRFIVRVRFFWKFLRVNLNITIINGMIIKSPHDS